MRFSSVLLCITGALATSFHIPQGQLDGVYGVSYNADGSENHTRLGDIETELRILAIRGATVQKRSGVITCDPNEGGLNANDNGAAATSLANQCGFGAAVGAHLNYYSIKGCSVAYFCNFKKHSQVCTSGNAWASFNDVNNICGSNVAGWEKYYDSDGNDQYGYQWFCTYPGSAFCSG
ncbi:hypothetical protein F4801DRAFT_570617 [Xylaria longipes]|nr:hypothetical protein F4801DRAFT_570617 [Xylaria longipes]